MHEVDESNPNMEIITIPMGKFSKETKNSQGTLYDDVGQWNHGKFLNYCSNPVAKATWKIQLRTKDKW